jgi:hypothetical protein
MTQTTPPTGGITQKIIKRVICGAVVLVALFLLLVTALVHHFTYVAAQTAAATHPPAAPTQPAAPVVRQLPDCTTPCTMGIAEIRDIYTDGEPVFMLPPGWSREKAIRYSGKGHIVVEGGNIHIGKWQFWSADDPTKVVLIRVFGR